MDSLVRAQSERRELTNLPLPLTSFVGRVSELSEVRGLLSRARLVTLTGAGGIGKTRLALEVAAQVVGDFPDGVWLVELASLTDAELVPQTIVRSLGFMEQPGRAPMEALIGAVKTRQVLCVVDNCEHLIDASARALNQLLVHCAGLRVLATSRNPLGIDGEVFWRVPSMARLDAPGSAALDEIQRLDMVQLFVDRARAARPDFRLNETNCASVLRVCGRLDGIPLAIEMAAARTRSMSVTEIEERLDDRFHLLTTSSRMSLPRQRTLRATIDWSHDLLTDGERRLFRRLAVFRGGFTLQAADSVCFEASAVSGGTLLDPLSGLVDKSLVAWDEGPGQVGRYSLLETVRQYAHDRLADANEMDALLHRHADYYRSLADSVHVGLCGPDQPTWATRVESELDNFRACYAWTLNHDPVAALHLTVSLERYWIMNDRGEGRDWVTRALAATTTRDEVRAHALYDASFWALFQGLFDEARRLGEECLSLAKELGSDLYIGQALSALAVIAGQERREGWSTDTLSMFEQAESWVRRADRLEALARCLNNYAYSLYLTGDLEHAGIKASEAVALSRELNDTWHVAAALGSLADVKFAMGDSLMAESHWKEALTLARDLRGVVAAADALEGLARLSLANGHAERSLRLLAAARSLWQRTGSFMDATWNAEVARTERAARDRLEPSVADAARNVGARMTFLDAIRLGLDEPTPMGEAVALPVPLAGAMLRAENTFLREGEFWSVCYGGSVVRLKDSKGLQDIAQLLLRPGREFAAVDLFSGERTAGNSRSGIADGMGLEADAGEALDAEARAQYRNRLTDLDEEINEGVANNDPERASRARDERAFLLAELGAAIGLGGRSRRVLDPAERARKAVTWRIRDAISHVEAAHPSLGKHLRRSIRTGGFCMYDPIEATSWRL